MCPVDEHLLTIGEFARRSRLSLKALRLYERLGLLNPAVVDPANGYRRYREEQLFTARLIVNEDSDGPVEVAIPVEPARRPPAGNRHTGRRTWQSPGRSGSGRRFSPHTTQSRSGFIDMAGAVSDHRAKTYRAGFDPALAAATDEVCDVAFPIT